MSDELKDIRRWYARNGVPYLDEDWGPQSETGESIGQQTQDTERHDVRSSDSTPARMWWWEKQHFPWAPRSLEEEAWVLLLDDFFTPYLAMLPRPKGELVRQVFGDLRTYHEVAEDTEMYDRSHARRAVQRALRELTRLIARDDPDFAEPADGRRRDYDTENEAAKRVFTRYVSARGQLH